SSPIALRAFLTIVGTREDTKVRVTTTARVLPGGPVKETLPNQQIEATLGAFDVLNLETDDFNADFTGSVIESDGPVAVFSGSEASDAPHFETLAERRCCADHLEDQLDPVRAAGKAFAVAHTASRTTAVVNAGADTAVVEEPDYVRFVAVTTAGAKVTTTLPPPDDVFVLTYQGSFHEAIAYRDFTVTSTEPISVAQVMASQDAAGIKRSLPGGDPSLVIIPPTEQFRPDYTFLTPDKYAFDFVSIVATPDAAVFLDGSLLGPERCTVTPTDGLTPEERKSKTPPYLTYTCQLGFATIDPLKTAPDNLTPGAQNDGVHRLVCSTNCGVIVTGFDSFVSYGYAAGTELRDIAVPK
ncbi:MAG: IgGFc-binding protein, partial [Polyangiaceae bacterium]